MIRARPFIVIITGTMLLGVIAFALNILFGMNTVIYLQQVNYNGVIMYKYNFWAYLENIYNTITNTAELNISMPQDQWITSNSITDIGNNLAYILNRFLIAINVLLFPFRVIFYAIQTLLAFIGLPMLPGTYDNNGLKWLIDTAKFLTNLQIPYVNQP